MKKLIKCGIVAVVAVAAGFAAYQSYGSYGAQESSLLMQNVEALANKGSHNEPNGNSDGNGPVYSTAETESKCRQEGGLWNMRLTPTGQGVVVVPKSKTINIPGVGEIKWFGSTGDVVAWCAYACTDYKGNNCCLQNQQGVWVNGVKKS